MSDTTRPAAGTAVRVRCVLFAGLREAAGQQELELTVPAGTRVGQLKQFLIAKVPAARQLIEAARFAVDGEYADERVLQEGDEVAVIPPVSGGATAVHADVLSEPLDLTRCVEFVRTTRAGAVVTFLGTVREFTDGRQTSYLEYEAYRDMAVRKLQQIAHEARGRFGLEKVAVEHRVGRMDPGEVSVVIAVSAAHRAPAFEGCRYMIETLKKEVPIWKKEVWADGTEEWVHPGM